MKVLNWIKKWIWDFCIKNIIKLCIIICFIYITFIFSVDKNNTGAILFAGFTLFFILFFWSSKFELVELLGAKFKMKKLEHSINELKDLSKSISIISLEIIQSKNRMGPGDKKKEQEFFNAINNILDNVNITPTEKAEIFNKYWHSWIIWDYFSYIRRLIENNLREKDGKWFEFDQAFREKSQHKYPENHTPKFLKEQLNWAKQHAINEYDWSNIEQHIDDFEYYCKNKTFKNFERWEKLIKMIE